MQLSVVGELTEEESSEINRLIGESEELRSEFDELRKITGLVESASPEEPSEDLLIHLRQNLMRRIRSEPTENSRPHMLEKVRFALLGNYRQALGAAFILLIGIFIGQYYFVGPAPPAVNSDIVDIDNFTPENFKIKNVRFVDNFSRNGEVEFVFDAVKPITYRGNMNDIAVQRILASALVTDNNPGSKIRTINRFAEQSLAAENFDPDKKVKEALIFSLKTDENPGVRRQALNVLFNYPLDQNIRDAFLYVLANDDNSGLRVAAINALAEYTHSRNQLDSKTKDILNSKAQSDNNDFIRLRAASLLLEEE